MKSESHRFQLRPSDLSTWGAGAGPREREVEEGLDGTDEVKTTDGRQRRVRRR